MTRGKDEAVELAIENDGNPLFVPEFYPNVVRVTRERNLDRTDKFCGDEKVTDKGAKNREIHLNGRVLGKRENGVKGLTAFDELLNQNEPLEFFSTVWSGRAHVDQGEYEGPTGWDPTTGEFYYDYTLDLVSTGEGSTENATAGVVALGTVFAGSELAAAGEEISNE